MSGMERQVRHLESREQEIVDRLVIYKLLCACVIAGDSLTVDVVRDLYTEDRTCSRRAKGGKPEPSCVGEDALLHVVNSDTHRMDSILGCASVSHSGRHHQR